MVGQGKDYVKCLTVTWLLNHIVYDTFIVCGMIIFSTAFVFYSTEKKLVNFAKIFSPS